MDSPPTTLIPIIPLPVLTHYLTETFFPLLIFSALAILYLAYNHTKDKVRLMYFRARRQAALASGRHKSLWNTDRHWVLSLLIDQWLSGLLPGDGIWKRVNAHSLRMKKDKSALQKLIRMGIYPLFIQDGGMGTSEERKGVLSPWGWWSWPLYKQSKRRAVFEFVVPRARGWMIEDAMIDSEEEKERRRTDKQYLQFVTLLCESKRLRQAARWRVAASGMAWGREEGMDDQGDAALIKLVGRSKFSPDARVPREIGATSRFEVLLPFKPDRVLDRGVRHTEDMHDVKNWVTDGQLLTTVHVPIVRIEAPDSEYIELDKEVLLIAQNLGLDEEWDEPIANFALRKAYRKVDLDPDVDFLDE